MLASQYSQRKVDELQKQHDLLSEKIKRLREALAVETSPARKFELEQQIQQAETERDEIETRIDELEQSFQIPINNVRSPSQTEPPSSQSSTSAGLSSLVQMGLSDQLNILLTINRVLLALCVMNFLILVFLLYLPIAEPLLVIIGMLVGLLTFLVPGIKRIHLKPWFKRLQTTVMMGAFILFIGAVNIYLLIGPSTDDLRIALLDGTDSTGKCGISCTVILEGENIIKLKLGQRLAVYGPQARLAGGKWSETPIAIVRVLGIEAQIAFAQVLLVHEAATTDSSKRLVAGLRVAAESEFSTDLLVPAFGDGYVYQEDTIYLRPGTIAQVEGCLVILKPQIRGQRVIDHLVTDTELQIITLGQEGIIAKTKLISGSSPVEGDIVQIKARGCLQLLPYEPEMILIPGNTFEMGSNYGKPNETPVTSVTIPDFYIAVTEVTNSQFRPFVEDNGYMTSAYWTSQDYAWREANGVTEPKYWNDPLYNGDQQPVIGVSWYEAMAYTRWLNLKTGKAYHLPTEAQWERVACGNPKHEYPWGDTWDGTLANFADHSLAEKWDFVTWADNSVQDGYAYTSPVGSYPEGATSEGILDIAGNVWEWTSSLYLPYPYKLNDGREDQNNKEGKRVTRGGGWGSEQIHLRCTYRGSENLDKRIYHLGFRLARDQ